MPRGLLRRYRLEAGDGLPGEEGAFAICGSWLVEALALAFTGAMATASAAPILRCGIEGSTA